MMMHCTVDLELILRQSDKKLTKMLKYEDGKSLSPSECRSLAIKKLREGYDVLPVCDHHDEKGYCLGHDSREESK